jgi:hypothetical protein
MADRFSPGRIGDWVVFCDICGQKCYASEASKLSTYTGRGGLIVCPKDADKVDPGLIPYKVTVEKNIPWTRINHTNVENSAPIYDLEAQTVEQISSYLYISTSQSDEQIITLSQDEDVYISVS